MFLSYNACFASEHLQGEEFPAPDEEQTSDGSGTYQAGGAKQARNMTASSRKGFDRLAGRVDALAILYQTVPNDDHKDDVDRVAR
ncbi:hypothetical protein ACFX5Q_32545 [Mesorhizobium sp. IMUNJ 23033]|uniref:hypothetical protein n=1 Tax=Mesorhizobium sp. IMUNJ 23033 TaxID=3378039 RepID=UPI00384AEE8E